MIQKSKYDVVGMHCASCKVLIEKAVKSTPGVKSANVNYGAEQLYVEYEDQETKNEAIENSVKELGSYRIIPKNAHEAHSGMAAELKLNEYKKLRLGVIASGVGVIPFAIQMLMMVMVSDPMEAKPFIHAYVQFAITSLIMFVAGANIFSSALRAIRKLQFNMDSLIAIGTFAAWSYSTFIIFFKDSGSEVYFEASAFIIFFVLLGRLLESRAKIRTNDAIKSLIKLQAKEATIIKDGKEIKININELQVGDILLIRPGEKIPTDGQISEGTSAIDESMISGESIPVDKSVGQNVYGATINLSSILKVKALKVGNQTLLAQIIRMVEDAQATQAPIQKLADKVSGIFVPVVISIALVAFVFWAFVANSLGLESSMAQSIYIAVTILIIACPCALGLAVPTALIVGSGKAAKMGILIKNAEALENLHKVNFVVFDKTGTLTLGKPKIEQIIHLGGFDPSLIESIIVSAESLSHHPLAQAIAKHLTNSKQLPVTDFLETPGFGITAKLNGDMIMIGTRKLLQKHNVTIEPEVLERYEAEVQKAKTTIFVHFQGKTAALITILDAPREEAKSIINQLKAMNIESVMLTGDNQKTAAAIGAELGIKNIISEVLPQDKANAIKELQARNSGSVVAMVGDGINDAPALAHANVGIAMGSGTDIAIEAGDIVILQGDLNKILQAVSVSKKTFAVIKQNLFWAFFYNIIGIPVAFGILYPFSGILLSPIIASAAMALSSVSVVTNSLRLKYI